MVASHASIALPRPAVQSSVSCKGLRFVCSKVNRAPASSLSLTSQRRLKVRAGLADGGELPGSTSKSSSTTAVQNLPVKSPSPTAPDDSSLQTVFVEDTNVAVEGVAKVDRKTPSSSDNPTWGRVALLAGGDVLVLLVFAAIGRFSHGMSVLDWDALRTADPFIAGWLLGAYLLGGYGPDGQGVNGFTSAVVSAGKSWAVGIPLALVIRGVTSGHVPAQPFIVVSMASTLVLLVGWRAAAITVFPMDKPPSDDKATGDKKGSIFELFQLLSSLVRRW